MAFIKDKEKYTVIEEGFENSTLKLSPELVLLKLPEDAHRLLSDKCRGQVGKFQAKLTRRLLGDLYNEPNRTKKGGSPVLQQNQGK